MMTPEQWSAHVAMQWALMVAQLQGTHQGMQGAGPIAAKLLVGAIRTNGCTAEIPEWLLRKAAPDGAA